MGKHLRNHHSEACLWGSDFVGPGNVCIWNLWVHPSVLWGTPRPSALVESMVSILVFRREGPAPGAATQPESCLTPVVGAHEEAFSARGASVSVICSSHQSARGGVYPMMSPPRGSPPAPHQDSSDTPRRSVACLRSEIQAYSEPLGVVRGAGLGVGGVSCPFPSIWASVTDTAEEASCPLDTWQLCQHCSQVIQRGSIINCQVRFRVGAHEEKCNYLLNI